MADISASIHDYVPLKKMQKLCKYKDLKIEINRIFDLKTEIISVRIGALEMIMKHSVRCITQISGLTNGHYI